jgi:hypothetical protein
MFPTYVFADSESFSFSGFIVLFLFSAHTVQAFPQLGAAETSAATYLATPYPHSSALFHREPNAGAHRCCECDES